MKLWRRRPLSEDLSRKDINFPDEMPPTLVYISPGNHGIFKRSSFTNKEYFDKFQFPIERNSFQVFESENKSNIGNYRFQSFRDYESKSFVKFEDNTLKSINKDCKSYLPPVSLEWSPVKDVMKICRSASVPFHSRISPRTDTPEANGIQITNVKSPHLSLSEKIKTFFRNRSTSRSSKQVLTSITENKSTTSSNVPDKGLCRTSRSRMKEGERCTSLYEPSRALNNEYCQKLNNVIRNNNSQGDCNLNKNFSPKQMFASKEKKTDEKNVQLVKKVKGERKHHVIVENQKRMKAQSLNPESPQRISLQGFSSSVVSHTTSSAAKCKTSSPKTPETDHNYQKNTRHLDRRFIKKGGEISASNFNKKISTMYDTPDFGKFDLPISYKPPQAMIAPKSDRKIANIAKSDVVAVRSTRFDSKECKQKPEYLLPNRIMVPVVNNINNMNIENKAPISDQRKLNNKSNVDDDDYVTLAEMSMQPPINNTSMTQSLYVSVLPEYSNVKEKYENIEINKNNQHRPIHQQKDIIFQKNKPRILPVSGEIRKRPISCMAVVNADLRIPVSDLEKNDQVGNMYPKSPYLSQYSKLYSLRTNDIDLTHRYGNEITDTDIMTRSQHSGHYKMSNMISKDQTGKLSIDSGLVDDINTFHSDSVQQTQNY